MVSKSFAAFKSFSELSQLILKHLASCKSLSLFNSQKLRVLLSSRCLIFKVLRSRFCSAFQLLSRALDYLTTFGFVCQVLFSRFFELFLLFKVSSFQKVYSPESLFRRFSLFWALSRALRYNTTPLPVCQRFFSFFCSFFSESRILCLSSSFSPRESSVSTLYNWDFPMV